METPSKQERLGSNSNRCSSKAAIAERAQKRESKSAIGKESLVNGDDPFLLLCSKVMIRTD